MCVCVRANYTLVEQIGHDEINAAIWQQQYHRDRITNSNNHTCNMCDKE